MALNFISASIKEDARIACIDNNVGVDHLLTGRNSEALFHFALAIQKMLKIVDASNIHELSMQEGGLKTQQEKQTCVFPLIKPGDQGEVIPMFAQLPSKNPADDESKIFHSSGMTREWLVTTTLIAIHNAIAACKILKKFEQAITCIETASALINDQYWSWKGMLLGNSPRDGQRQTLKFLMVSFIYHRGRLFLEMFNKRLLKEQNAPRSSLLTEELHNIVSEAVHSFSIVAASNQETCSLLIQQEQSEDYRRFQEINLLLVVKAWSWLGYAISLLDASSSFMDTAYGVARKNYNALCCISGNYRCASSDSCGPTTVPSLSNANAAPLA
jgi:hypothetical protein